MDAREFKGLEIAAKANVRWTGTFWLVPSQSKPGSYKVNADATECSCEDFEINALVCKHIHAARFVKARHRFQPIPAAPSDETPENPIPKKPTYKQNWPAYNKAQKSEKRVFLGLLADLCGTVAEPPRKRAAGRPPIPIKDALFAALFKVYSGFSARRFMTDLQDAEERSYISSAPHFNHIFRILDRDGIGEILRQLIVRSSLPLRAVESKFAVDSSGFSTNKFIRWFDTKHGVDRRRATWVKTHIIVGVNTQVVTAAAIGDAHDSVMFPDLVRETGENFRLEDVLADKAYLSRENLELVESAGGTAYIPFKVNNRPDKNGETWEKLFHAFAWKREEFLQHYHQRSNIESAFSMVKRKIGDSIRSKTPVAMTNEVLAKLVCHNLIVLVHEMFELGIDPGFAPREPSHT